MTATRVLITVPDVQSVITPEVFFASGSGSHGPVPLRSRLLDVGVPPSLALDHEFGPVPLRVSAATAVLASSFEHELEASPAFVVRGLIDSQDLEQAQNLKDDAGNPRVFSDPPIGLLPTTFKSPPIGTASDVQRLLRRGLLSELGMDGSGVALALMDNGINLAYLRDRGLQPTMDVHLSWSPNEAIRSGAAPVDHGTMCAYDALLTAPRVTLMDFAVARTTRVGGSAMDGFLSDALLAYSKLLGWMRLSDHERPYHSLVVSNSWAVFSPIWDFPPGSPGRYMDNLAHPFHQVVSALSNAGADIVFAAGNCGDVAPDGRCGFATLDPKITGANSYPEVITVAGVDVHGEVAGYSSRGPGSIDESKPDIAAYTHFKGSEAFGKDTADSGTSAACPVFAGVLAALRTQAKFVAGSPKRSPAALKSYVCSLAASSAGIPREVGHGIVSTAEFGSAATNLSY